MKVKEWSCLSKLIIIRPICTYQFALWVNPLSLHSCLYCTVHNFVFLIVSRVKQMRTPYNNRSWTISERDSHWCSCQAALAWWRRCAHRESLTFPHSHYKPSPIFPAPWLQIRSPSTPHAFANRDPHLFQAQADAQLTKPLLDPTDLWFFLLWDTWTLRRPCRGSRLSLGSCDCATPKVLLPCVSVSPSSPGLMNMGSGNLQACWCWADLQLCQFALP